jgi:hypothetical protein
MVFQNLLKSKNKKTKAEFPNCPMHTRVLLEVFSSMIQWYIYIYTWNNNIKMTFQNKISFKENKQKLNYPTVHNIDICWFSAKHTALRRKRKDGLVLNQDNLWGGMFICSLLFQWDSTIKVQLNKADLIIISLKINLFSPW